MAKGTKVLSDPRDSEIRYLKGIVSMQESRIGDLESMVKRHSTKASTTIAPKAKAVRPAGPTPAKHRGRPRKIQTEETASV